MRPLISIRGSVRMSVGFHFHRWRFEYGRMWSYAGSLVGRVSLPARADWNFVEETSDRPSLPISPSPVLQPVHRCHFDAALASILRVFSRINMIERYRKKSLFSIRKTTTEKQKSGWRLYQKYGGRIFCFYPSENRPLSFFLIEKCKMRAPVHPWNVIGAFVRDLWHMMKSLSRKFADRVPSRACRR